MLWHLRPADRKASERDSQRKAKAYVRLSPRHVSPECVSERPKNRHEYSRATVLVLHIRLGSRKESTPKNQKERNSSKGGHRSDTMIPVCRGSRRSLKRRRKRCSALAGRSAPSALECREPRLHTLRKPDTPARSAVKESTPRRGFCIPNASPFAAAKAIRMPVKRPGPNVAANASTLRRSSSRKTSSTRTSSFSPACRAFPHVRSCSVLPAARNATETLSPLASKAKILAAYLLCLRISSLLSDSLCTCCTSVLFPPACSGTPFALMIYPELPSGFAALLDRGDPQDNVPSGSKIVSIAPNLANTQARWVSRSQRRYVSR